MFRGLFRFLRDRKRWAGRCRGNLRAFDHSLDGVGGGRDEERYVPARHNGRRHVRHGYSNSRTDCSQTRTTSKYGEAWWGLGGTEAAVVHVMWICARVRARRPDIRRAIVGVGQRVNGQNFCTRFFFFSF